MQAQTTKGAKFLKLALMEEGKRWIYSNNGFDHIALLCSLLRVQRQASFAKLITDGRRGLEKS